MLLSLLLVAIALPTARAVLPDRSTHSRLALLHEIEDDVRELDATLDVRSTDDGALHEFERDGADDLFKAAGPPSRVGRALNRFGGWITGSTTEKELEKKMEEAFLKKLEDTDLTTPLTDCDGAHCPTAVTYRDHESKYTVLMQLAAFHDWPNAATKLIETCDSETHTCGCDDSTISCSISPRYNGRYESKYDANVEKKLEEWAQAKRANQHDWADALLEELKTEGNAARQLLHLGGDEATPVTDYAARVRDRAKKGVKFFQGLSHDPWRVGEIVSSSLVFTKHSNVYNV